MHVLKYVKFLADTGRQSFCKELISGELQRVKSKFSLALNPCVPKSAAAAEGIGEFVYF